MPLLIRLPKRKPFRVFEAGMGTKPVGLVQRAARLEKKSGRKWFFTGVDIKPVNLNRLLNAARLKQLPKKRNENKKPSAGTCPF